MIRSSMPRPAPAPAICSPSAAFPRFESHRHINPPRPEELALARVSKDGHRRDRASGHPSRRRFAPPQDEVCGFKLPPIRLAEWDADKIMGPNLTLTVRRKKSFAPALQAAIVHTAITAAMRQGVLIQ